MEQYFQVGVITSTHGVHGEVKVFPTTDDPKRFKKLKKVLLQGKRNQLELEITGVKFFKQFVILKFKGFDNMDDVAPYKNCPLLITRDQAVPLSEDEYFIADMIGLDVIQDNGSHFGILRDVMETGANDVYIIDTDDHGEVLIPAIKECVLSVDVREKRMVIHLMEGLIK